MNEDSADRDAIAATRSVALLNAQADALRADIAHLRRELAKAQQDLRQGRTAIVATVDEELVSAAVHADTAAQTAVSSLDELARYSQLDELTGVPNRTLLLDRLENAVAMARRRETRVAVLFIDLDHFKPINDTLGHGVGDLVLQVVTRRLQSAVRDSDTVSRHGGDEFLVLLPEIVYAADAAAVARKMLAALAEPCRIGAHVLELSASIGISVFPEDGQDGPTLIGHADEAMYRAKRNGPGRYQSHRAEPSSGAAQPPPAATEKVPSVDAAAPATGIDVAFAEHESRLRELLRANQQLVAAAQTAQQWRAHAEAAHQRQIEFVAMAAHAMRNPLSVIRMAAHGMGTADATLRAWQQNAIRRHVGFLLRLIDDLLDGSLVGTGQFRLQAGVIDVDDVLDLALEACRADAEAKSLRLEKSAAPGGVVHGDSARLVQAFGNLIQNATRRSPEAGRVAVTSVVSPEDVTVTVSDHGVGIAADALPKIFDLFAVDTNVPLEQAGLGIGLAVARELVSAHGGSVVARNRDDGPGSDFIVRLPLASAQLATS